MLALALVLEALTLFGEPGASVFDLGAWGKKRILVMWGVLLVVYGACHYFGLLSAASTWLACSWRERRSAIPRVLFLVGGFIGTGLGFLACSGLIALTGLYGFNFAVALFSFALGGCAFIVFANRASLGQNPERTFVPLGIVMGVLIALVTPVQTSVSPDDHIHYDRAFALSYLSSPEYTVSDMSLLSPPYIVPGTANYWSFSPSDYQEVIDGLNKNGSIVQTTASGFTSAMGIPTLQYSSLGYLPEATGLWLGRLLHLPFVATFLLGRIAGVLFFFTLVYFGVRHLKSQKVLALAFALVPTVLFLGANYSYDTWVTGWLLFGFLRYLSWLQNPDEKLSLKEVLVVVLSFVVGLGPKAIYFPIFFLLLFIPRAKFPSQRFAMRYRFSIVVVALLVCSTFFLPFVVQGPGGGDVRGGSDVNAGQQVLCILGDPLRYLGVLGNYLPGYLSLGNAPSCTVEFGYLGTSMLGCLPLVSLIIVSITDSGIINYPYALWQYRIGALALILGTSMLMASALYVSFTAVGSGTIAGMQGRYLLPLLLPFLALFLNSKMRNENSRTRYNAVVLVVSMAFVIVCVTELNLSVYAG